MGPSWMRGMQAGFLAAFDSGDNQHQRHQTLTHAAAGLTLHLAKPEGSMNHDIEGCQTEECFWSEGLGDCRSRAPPPMPAGYEQGSDIAEERAAVLTAESLLVRLNSLHYLGAGLPEMEAAVRDRQGL